MSVVHVNAFLEFCVIPMLFKRDFAIMRFGMLTEIHRNRILCTNHSHNAKFKIYCFTTVMKNVEPHFIFFWTFHCEHTKKSAEMRKNLKSKMHNITPYTDKFVAKLIRLHPSVIFKCF